MQLYRVASFLFAFFTLGLLTSAHVIEVEKRQTSAATDIANILSSLSTSLDAIQSNMTSLTKRDDSDDIGTLADEIVAALTTTYEDLAAISVADVYPINTTPEISEILQAVISDTVAAAQTIQLQAQTETIYLSNIDTAFSQGLIGLQQLVPDVLSAIEVFLQTTLEALQELDLELTIAVIELYTDL